MGETRRRQEILAQTRGKWNAFQGGPTGPGREAHGGKNAVPRRRGPSRCIYMELNHRELMPFEKD